MANASIAFGTALILLGAGGLFATGAEHPTELLPAAAGVLLIVFGLLARNPKLRMHAMHGAALIGLLGLAGSVSGIVQFIKMVGGETVLRPAAAVSRSIMAVLCPGTFVLDRACVVRLAQVEPDYMKRLEPAVILDALLAVRS
jgi:hypothetical protein